MQIKYFNLGQTQLVDSTWTCQEGGAVGWKKIVAKNQNKIYQIEEQTFKVVDKWERYLPFFSLERVKGVALGILCTLLTVGLSPFFSKLVRQLFSGRQVRRVVEEVLVKQDRHVQKESIVEKEAENNKQITKESIEEAELMKNDKPIVQEPLERQETKPKALIYMSITGHPTHLGHMAVVAEAIHHLLQKYQITQAYISLASQDYLKGKVKKGDPCLTYEQRKHILLETIKQAAATNMFRGIPVEYTPLEQELSDHPFVYKRLKETNKEQEVFFVCGPDLYPKTAISFKKVIVLGREEMNGTHKIMPDHTFIHPNLYPQYAGLSSTKIRSGQASLEPQSLDVTFRDWY